ncbi:MAG: Peptide chain release factor 2 [Chlamydiae bacterium]|nr:Peptide chain release factor 2 [Chlamydiota bacterium]
MIAFYICGGIFDLAKKQERLKDLTAQMESPTFWEDPSEAQKVIDESNQLKAWTDPYQEIKRRFENVQELLPEVNESDEAEFFAELIEELVQIETLLEELEIRKMLSGELDPKNCYLSINSGAGGTEACDWAQMLTRMYERWASKRGWKVETIDCVEGEVAGIKNITLKISGSFAYGYCKAEKGVHRLVRISPFDSNAKRHTSFASVDATPEIDEDIQVEIRPDQIRVDTFRASGAGGQHVNTTDSAVRITHLSTGIVVTCQNERSQIQNKETCMKLLKAKLYEKECLERESKIKELGGEKMDIAWGSQIRNYVFQPYTLVKDTRTKYEVGNIDSVMDGDLDGFIHAFLKEFG